MLSRTAWILTVLASLFLSSTVTVAADEPTITVTEATYASKIAAPPKSSKSCVSAKSQNLTTAVANLCDGKTECSYTVPMPTDDPAEGCYKNFQLKYHCGSEDATRVVDIGGVVNEAAKQTITMDCALDSGINVTSATYGAELEPVHYNCSAVETGNATTEVKELCDGKNTCSYPIDVSVLGDPAFGCKKNFVVSYQCNDQGPLKTTTVAKEANGKNATLRCPEGSGTTTTGVTMAMGNLRVAYEGKYVSAPWEYTLSGMTDGQIYKIVAQYWTDSGDKSKEIWPHDRATQQGLFTFLDRRTTYHAQITVTMVVDHKVYTSNVVTFTTP